MDYLTNFILLKSFRIQVLFRLLLILGMMGLLSYSHFRPEPWVLTNIFLGVFILGMTIALLRYVERSQRELSTFLMSIKHRDFSLNFTTAKLGKPTYQLHEAFNTIMDSFRKLRVEKEAHYQYLKNIIEHIRVALICFGEDGNIVLMNQAAHNLLVRPYLGNISGLEKVDASLYQTISTLKPGEQVLKKVVIKGDLLHLAIHTSSFKLVNDSYTLLSLQDIKSELEEQEVESWQKLIRVLTHEIMNSVTPVLSLTGALNRELKGVDGQEPVLTDDSLQDIRQGIQAIENRSEGLLQFVHAYRNLTRIPTPQIESVSALSIFNRLHHLFKEEWDKAGIQVDIQVDPEELEVLVDANLIDQVLINLIKNAMDAVRGREKKNIVLKAGVGELGRILIQVFDSGGGIDPELREKIFIPFFTTKKQGSGIGLSLSRQIMRLHKGNITFHTDPEEGTVFTLTF